MLTWFLALQRSTLDFVAITLGVVASLRPAAAELIPARPPQQISSCKNFVLLLESVAISVAFHWGCLAFLYHEPWFSGSTSANEQASVPACSSLLLSDACNHVYIL